MALQIDNANILVNIVINVEKKHTWHEAHKYNWSMYGLA